MVSSRKPRTVNPASAPVPRRSQLEVMLKFQMDLLGLPAPAIEYVFAPPRRWRFDFAWPDRMLAVECEGGVWTRGRHTRGSGYIADLEKYNAATIAGWRLLRFDVRAIKSWDAVYKIKGALEASPSRTTPPDCAHRRRPLRGR